MKQTCNPPPTGMDHNLYQYQADSRRPGLLWPHGARIAVWPIIYLEYHEFAPPDDALQDPRFRGEFGDYRPDFRTTSRREYGNRVGIFRVLDTLRQFGIRGNVAANAMSLLRRPSLAAACVDAGHEICAHGIASNRMVSSRTPRSQELAWIIEAYGAVKSVSGVAPSGWISQDFGQSTHTANLLAEAGFAWLGDWPNDDCPYLLETHPQLVSIPYQVEWDDAHVMEVRKLPAWTWQDIAERAFRRLYDEGGRIFGIGLHPWVVGHPHRIRYLQRLLALVVGTPNVWIANGTEIARAFRASQ
ncbi:MAG: polysaccharide deacetylase family protein [Woeseia sp.]